MLRLRAGSKSYCTSWGCAIFRATTHPHSSISYHRPPLYAGEASALISDNSKRKRKKRGRPKVHWSKRASRARMRDPRFLRRDQVQRAFAADLRAEALGLSLKVFVSVRWSLTDREEVNIARRWTNFLSSFGRWCRLRSLRPAFIWVHENPPKATPSFNTHMLVNVPIDLMEDLKCFMMAHFRAHSDSAVDVRNRTAYGFSKRERLAYMLKGTDRATAMKYHLFGKSGAWKGSQGCIPFKRIGFSRLLRK